MDLNDVVIRFEAVKISAAQKHPTYGVADILFDAKRLYDFIKTGNMPEIETATSRQSLHGGS